MLDPGIEFIHPDQVPDTYAPNPFVEELVCIGDSLDVLSDDPDCGIGDPEALLEELCKLSPDAFCD